MKTRMRVLFPALCLALSLLTVTAMAEGEQAKIGAEIYPTLREALLQVKDGDTIEVLSDINDQGDKAIFINKNGEGVTEYKLTIDLGNHAVRVKSPSGYNFNLFGGEVTIQNGTLEKDDVSPNYGGLGMVEGKLTMENLAINNGKEKGYAVDLRGGESTFRNVTITSSKGGGVVVGKGDKVTKADFYDCIFAQSGQGNPSYVSMNVAAATGSTATIYSGTYSSENYSLYVYNSGGTIDVYDGNFSAGKAVLKADKSIEVAPSQINVHGGSFSGKFEIADGAALKIFAGTFSNTGLTLAEFEAYVAQESLVSESEGVYTVEALNEETAAAKIGDKYYKTLGDAITDAKSGDVVNILPGTYSEKVILPAKSITLEGAAGHTSILTGGIALAGGQTSYQGVGFTIKGLAFQENGIEFVAWNANKDLNGMTGLTVQDCTFENIKTLYGVHINNGDVALRDLTVKDCAFTDIGYTEGANIGGIYATACGEVTITGNTFTRMGLNGITLIGKDSSGRAASKITITGNTFDQWGKYPENGVLTGRAMRLSHFLVKADLTNNRYICSDMPEEYVKFSETQTENAPDMRLSYWNGENPASQGFKLIAPAGTQVTPYYLRPEMKDSDRSDYVETTPPPPPSGDDQPSGGGSGSDDDDDSSPSNTTTQTTKNDDGSTTTTVTDNKTGTVTETTRTPDGVTGTTVTGKDGQVASAKANLSAAAAREAAKSGQPVGLPVSVPPAKDPQEAPEIRVTLPEDADPVKVLVPVENATPGTVAVLVHPDGREEILPASAVTEDGVVLELEGSATVKIVDNSKDFTDIPQDYWAAGAVDYVSARRLFTGTGEDTFSPAAPATRAQLMTVLARLDGADTSLSPLEQGMAWAVERGISDGADPDGHVSRQQLLTMMWRYAGEPEADGAALEGFTDGEKAAGYAEKALAWAVEKGILTGTAEGALDPEGKATRAQLAAMFMRFNQAMV